jgi:protein TonB
VAAEISVPAQAFVLALVLAAHGAVAALALRVQASPQTLPKPFVIQARWIEDAPSSGGQAETESAMPQAAASLPAALSSSAPPSVPLSLEAPLPETSLPEPSPLELPLPAPPPPEPPPKVKRPPRAKPPLPAAKPSPVPNAESARPATTEQAVSEARPETGATLAGAAASGPRGISGSSGPSGTPGPATGLPTHAAPGPAAYTEPNFRAKYLSNPPPGYPPASVRRQEEGTVILKVRVTADGRADELSIDQGSGFARLDQAAVDAVRRWRFVPARRGDENVPGWVRVPVRFNLEQ